MIIEQPASLNRYIEPSVPFTWGLRWRVFKLFMPVLTFLALVLFQSGLLKAWETGDWDAGPFIGVLISWSLIIFSVEISAWLRQKQKKTMRLEMDHVRTGSGSGSGLRVRWQQIIAWHFYNLADLKDYQVAGIEYKSRKKSRNRRMVLPRSEVNQLVSELKSRQKTEGLPFSIIDHDSDFQPFEFKRHRSIDLYLRFLGLFLLYEGSLLLVCAEPSASKGILASFIRSHISSEPGHFALVVGSILCGSGIVLFVWSVALDSKSGSYVR